MNALQTALKELHPSLVSDSNVTDFQFDYSGSGEAHYIIELTKEALPI